MKKIFMTMLIFLTFISCVKQQDTSEKMEIGELISIRNSYQSEYDLLHLEWEARRIQRCIANELQIDYDFIEFEATYEEFCREKVLKDSIEILNVMINNYKF